MKVSIRIGCLSVILALILTMLIGASALAAEEVSADDAIQSVTAIGFVDLDGVKLGAVAVEYDADMTGLVINLKGDDIIGLDGTVREDIKIVLDPYEFYDADGNKLDVTLKNAYVSDTAATVEGAERGEGSGHFVIVEFDGAADAEPAAVIQRTTVRTDTVIAPASYKLHE